MITHAGVIDASLMTNSFFSVGDGSESSSMKIVIQRMEHNLGFDVIDYCRGTTSGTGTAPLTFFSGSAALADGGANFTVSQLPPAALAFPLVSYRSAPVVATGAPQSALNGLCLGRPFFRYLPNGQVPTADAAGLLSFSVDPGAVPSPSGVISLQPGDSLYIQLWFRDPMTPTTSGFNSAHWIEFR